jgi:type I restriction enzyme S subunit
MVTQTVENGYKQTELGIIPEDWETKRLEQVSSEIGDGIHATPEYVGSSEIYFINGNNLANGSIEITSNTMCVSEEEYKKYKKKIGAQTILMSINGTIGNLAYFDDERVVLGKSAAYINLDNSVSKEYIFYLLQSAGVKNYYENELTGTTIRNLSLASLRNTPISLPPTKEEQSAIAGVLSDTDALIASLDKLIEKKRNIKRGAMQELLTGKKRFPGFSGKWESAKLGEECELITKGTTPTSIGKDFKKYGINFIKIEALEENGKILKDNIAFIDSETNNLLKRSILKENDILISIAGALGRVTVVTGDILPANTNQALAICRLRKEAKIVVRYLFHFLNSAKIKKQIELVSVQGAQANLSLENIYDMTIEYPSVPEQTVIAQVLSDMDSEIE